MNRILRRFTAAAVAVSAAASCCVPLYTAAGVSLNAGSLFGRRSNAVGKPSFAYSMPRLAVSEQNDGGLIAQLPYMPIKNAAASENSGTLPTRFDLRDTGRISSVKDQGEYGTCWTHSSAASAESSIIDAVPDIDLAEMHTAYFPYFGGDQIDIGTNDTETILNHGGSSSVVVNLWSQWLGPVSEERFPYGKTEVFDDSDYAEKLRLRDRSDYHLKNAYMLEYADDNSDREEVTEQIKQFLYSGHAVDVSFYYDFESNYNNAYSSSYTERKPRFANHSVTIAGWDDSFPAYNFKNAPPADGAWLIKNSWGMGASENGYMWISYYDKSLSSVAVYELSDKEDYSYNLHHDTFIPTQTLTAYGDADEIRPSYMANVFSVEDAMQIEAIGTYFVNPDTDYEITVYTDLKDRNNPASGTPSSVTRGTQELTGYMTIELDRDVAAEADSYIGVVVKMYCPYTPFVIPIEGCITAVDENDGTIVDIGTYTKHERLEAFTGLGESFFSSDGENWTDTLYAGYDYTEDDELVLLNLIKNELYDDLRESDTKLLAEADKLSSYYEELFAKSRLSVVMGNISLKAFGSPVNSVDFSHISGQVPNDEAVTLSVKDGSTIYYSLGGEYMEYTSPIRITEPVKVTATTDFDVFEEREYSPTKARFNDICSVMIADSGEYFFGKAEKTGESEYVINMDITFNAVRLFTVTSADVTLDGKTVDTGDYSEPLMIPYGETVLMYHLTEEGKLNNDVTLRIVRMPLSIDLEKETVEYPADCLLINNDGGQIPSGADISPYIGQTLDLRMGDEHMSIEVPKRAVLPELEIDYYSETLGFVPNDMAELLMCAVGEGASEEDFVSASRRLIDGTWVNSGMIMNKAIRIIPGETITFKLRAGKGCFAGEPVTYKIPEAGEAPKVLPPFRLGSDDTISFGSNKYEIALRNDPAKTDIYAMSADWIYYDITTFKAVLRSRLGLESDEQLMSYALSVWDSDNSPSVGSKFMIRYAATNTSFASKGREFTAKRGLMGDVDGSGKIEAYDASLVLTQYTYISGGKEGIIAPEYLDRADYDRDGKITAYDASAILTLYTQLSSGKFRM